MTRTIKSPLDDPELVSLLADEPELLALADAVFETIGPERPLNSHEEKKKRRIKWRRRSVPIVTVAAAGAAAVGVMLISPWQSTNGGLVQRALAAVGDGPVVHAVLEQPAAYGQLVDLSTGRNVSQSLRTDVWFDQARNIEAARTSVNGQVIDRMLETPQGSWTTGGPVFTCAWIAAHPAEAARARVNCGPGSTTTASEQVVVDPAVAGFVDNYRTMLASGQATEDGKGIYDGHQVTWLTFKFKPTYLDHAPSLTERVAVDSATSTPLAVEDSAGNTLSRVVEIATVARNEADFAKPPQIDRVNGSSVISATTLSPADAVAWIGGQGAWLGQATEGVQFTASRLDLLNVAYGPLSSRPSHQVAGVEFDYVRADSTQPPKQLTISESRSCLPGWGWRCSAVDPQPGFMLLRGPLALVRAYDLYITLWNWDNWSPAQLADFASALRPLTP